MAERAKPRDRIRATQGNIAGNEYTVIECPPKYRGNPYGNYDDVVWVLVDRTPCTIKHDEYEIISLPDKPRKKVVGDTVSCKDCGGTGRIQLFTSIIDCDCTK